MSFSLEERDTSALRWPENSCSAATGLRVLVRPGSERKVPEGCEMVHGDALRAETYAHQVSPSDTFVHLVGVAHPNPKKAAEFHSIDLQSCVQAVQAAKEAGVRQFVYLSVARPAPIMLEYQAARAQESN